MSKQQLPQQQISSDYLVKTASYGLTSWHNRKGYKTCFRRSGHKWRKRREFLWSEECQADYPILAAPNFTKEFKLAVDASDIGAGAVLLPEDNKGIDHPFLFSQEICKHPEKVLYHWKRVVSANTGTAIFWDLHYCSNRAHCSRGVGNDRKSSTKFQR